MVAKKKTKKVTLAEFRAWLEGVEEMQVSGWTPSAEQWKLIRDKINNITADVVEKVVEKKVVEQPEAVNVPYTPVAPANPAAPMGPSSLDILEPSAPKPVELDGRIKTPTIDTSDGNYKSGFI